MLFLIKENAAQIAELNDQFRQTFEGGKVVYSKGVEALSTLDKAALFAAVKGFSNFNAENDPYQEHNFGAIRLNQERYFFVIEYYALDEICYSENPANPSVTKRVMTIITNSEFHR